MVTEEERKNFLTLRRILLANGEKAFSWEANDTSGQEPEFDDFVGSDDIRIWKGYNNIQIIDLPQECIQSLRTWYEREVSSNFDDVQSSLYDMVPNDVNYETLEFKFDCITKEISASLKVTYTEESDEDGNSWSDNEEVSEICQNFRNQHPNCNILTVQYYGGGDSGSIEDVYCDGEYLNNDVIPLDMENFIYSNLPGGWEINEGSRGQYIFDLAKNQVEHSHINYYDSEESATIVSDKF